MQKITRREQMNCPMIIADVLSQLGWRFDNARVMWRKDLPGGIMTLPATWHKAVEQELSIHLETRSILDAGGVHYGGC